MRFWFIDLPALLFTLIWRVYFIVVTAVVTLCVVTVLIMLGAIILGLPVPFVGQPPSPGFVP